jgi:hypothetical protein
MESRKMITRTLIITTLAVVMALAMMMPITYAIMWVGPGGHVGKPTPPPRHGGAPIYTPTMIYIPSGGGGGGGGSGGGGTSTFSTPSSNGNGQPQAVITDYSNGVVTQSTPYGTVGHGGAHVPVTSTTSQSTSTTSGQSPGTQVITITKTYTQYVYDTYEVNHYIYEYMYPIIQWVFTLVNIGSQQAPGYHSINNEKLFTPGFGGSNGIFVPVYAQEAIYTLNIAPSTKPVITGWHVGRTSQSSSGPFLVSQSSTPPQLSSVQDTVNNAGQAVSNIQQLATSSGNGLSSKTYVYYGNGGGGTSGSSGTTPTPSPTPNTNTNSSSQTWECPWAIIDKVGPYGCYADSILGEADNISTIAIVTWNQTSYQQIANMVDKAFQNLINNLPPGLLPPGVVSPPGFHNKFIHSGALAGVPIIGAPVTLPISGLGSVLGSVGGTILNGVENGLKWLHL